MAKFAYGDREKYIVDPISGCWLWQGSLKEKGYAQINIDGRPMRAHIYFWELKNGSVPEGISYT